MPEQFHFLEPLWLLMLLPLAAVLYGLHRAGVGHSPWERLVDPRLQPLLLGRGSGRAGRWPVWLLALGWLLATLALANPAWERKPHPLRQAGASRVIVLDLSRSMLATDLRPSRLIRARFKVEDLLNLTGDGQTGLVVFAGDAFTVSPLTRDAETVRAQLRVLEPAIMPAQGSRADLGLKQAFDLLRQAGVPNGEVILIADGSEGRSAVEVARQMSDAGHRVSVLAVGTEQGAPLPGGRTGQTRVVRLEAAGMQAIAAAGGGGFARLSADSRDIAALLAGSERTGPAGEADEVRSLAWKERGPWLVILLLPLAALAFRRGWLLSVLLGVGLAVPPQPALALAWDEIWLRRDQRAAQALGNGDYAAASQLAKDPRRRGAAAYRQGDYASALEAFQAAGGADAAYNRGNALARLGRYPEAIEAYEEALEQQPDMADARFNKAAVEALLQREAENRQSEEDERAQEEESSDKAETASQDAQDSQSGSEEEDAEAAGKQPQDSGEASGGEDEAEQDTGSEQDDATESEQAGEGSPDDQASAPEEAGEDDPGGAQRAEQSGDAGADGADGADTGDTASPERPGNAQGPDVDAPDEQGRMQDAPDSATGEAETADQEQTGQTGREARPDTRGQVPNVGEDPASGAEDAGSETGRDEGEGGDEPNAGEDRESGEPGGGEERQDEGAGPSGQMQDQAAGGYPAEDALDDRAPGRPTAASTEQQLARQQWLRRIPDDPGGLLRRKFLYQYRQRGPRTGDGSAQDW